MKLLFICTGNTCRSPLAQALMLDASQCTGLECEVDSAGLECGYGGAISQYSNRIIERRGIFFTHTTQPLTQELCTKADVIVTMTAQQKEIVKACYSTSAEVICAADLIGGDVPDPYGRGEEAYERCAESLDKLCGALIAEIRDGGLECGGVK